MIVNGGSAHINIHEQIDYIPCILNKPFNRTTSIVVPSVVDAAFAWLKNCQLGFYNAFVVQIERQFKLHKMFLFLL